MKRQQTAERKTPRRQAVKRVFFAAVCFVLCLCAALPAFGEEKRLPEKLESGIRDGECLKITVDGFSFRRLRALTENGVKLVNRLLDGASLSLRVSGNESGFVLEKDGTAYIDFSERLADGQTVTRVNGGELTSDASPIGTDFGEAFAILPFAGEWPYNIAWIARRAMIFGMPAETETNRSFSHAGSMKKMAVYHLTGDQAVRLTEIIRRILGDFPPSREAKEYLQAVVFGDEVTFTLYRNKSGVLSAFEIAGDVVYMEQERSFSLSLAGGADALSFSVTSKAKSGKDSFSDSLWFERTGSGRTVTYTGGEETASRLGNERMSRAVSFSLSDRLADSGEETVSGQVKVIENQNGKETPLTVKPELSYFSGRGEGTVDAVHKTGDTADVSADFRVSFGFEENGTPAKRTRSLESEEDVYFELLRAFTRMMMNESQEDRMLLAHELRDASWLSMEDPASVTDSWEEEGPEAFFVR